MDASPNKYRYIKLWEKIESKELFTSKRLTVRQDTCRLPSKRIIDDYLVVEVPDGAAIVAITEEKEIVLVRQYKHGLGQIVLELPAGNVEENEDPAHTIKRELLEETGYVADNVEFISILATKPARMFAKTHVYFASNVRHSGKQMESDTEVIEIVLVPVNELPALIQKGDIITETSLAALMMVWKRTVTF